MSRGIGGVNIDPWRFANLKWLTSEWAKQFRQFTKESFGFTRHEISEIMDEVFGKR